MENFKLIERFNPEAVAKELIATNLWNWLNLRKAPGLNHNVVDDIVLRFQPVQGQHTLMSYFNDLDCVDYFSQGFLKETMKLVTESFDNSKLGRIIAAKLQPGSVIKLHKDEGDYVKAHDRFHLVVTTNSDVKFTCEAEEVHMNAGEIWWFDNKKEHSVVNNGSTERIHVVVDMRK
jgi:quercetin dioxygenase-like cupin family protein